MKMLTALTRRNCKLFFKDKGMFLASLLSPMILLFLYATFLANVYRSSFTSALPEGVEVTMELIDATVGGQLIASLLAVCCVTIAFCSNMLMVQDKVTGARKDLTMTPVSNAVLGLSYYLATVISTLLVCLITAGASLYYLSRVGWYLNAEDVALLLLDVFLLVMFGTALSSLCNVFLNTQGQMNAVGTVVSSGYGFLCGAYMPIAQFGEGLRNALSFLPGTYGTSILRNCVLRGVFAEMTAIGFPAEVVEGIQDSIDCNLYFFGTKVELPAMFAILGSSILILIAAYVLVSILTRRGVTSG